MRSRAPARYSRGMTLIEVMVALSLLALLSVGVVSSFRLGEHTYRQLTHDVSDERDIVTAQRFLRQILESSYPFRQAATARARAFGLEGTSSELAVTAPVPQGLGGKGNYRYLVHLASTAGGSKNLVVRWCLDRNGATTADCSGMAGEQEEILVADVEVAEWSYLELVPTSFGAVSATEPGWHSSWLERRSLPTLVKLHVGFRQTDRRTWPDLVVAPRVTDDANCQFDIVAQACREM